MNVIEKLLKPFTIPRMIKVRQHFQTMAIADVAAAVHQSIEDTNVLSRIHSGDQVGIAVGSRGVADIALIVRETVKAVRSAGGEPFIIPAMGSHGGATAEGQRAVLSHLGVTEAYIGAPIRATMETVEIGRLANGMPVFMDKHAHEADKLIVINRVKPHTAFRGKVESGLLKMITIGLGKQTGAETAHAYGFQHMAQHVWEMSQITLAQAPIIFGIATVENAYDRPGHIEAIPAERIADVEPGLLLKAKQWMPSILFDPLDVLVVDGVGKDISGSGMDPNITGRFPTPFAAGGIQVSRLVALGLTEASDGNHNGLGLADITTRQCFDQIDWSKGWANALTSTVVNTVKIPMFMETSELAVKAAIRTCNAPDLSKVRLVRIPNTLHVQEIWISESLLSEARQKADIEILGEPENMIFP
ncbi:lactate racemase domain-containing protein [Paenibacillus agricola]|uniref:DUF2088 domain-containing protein n=1 Tax=Paenibacillus agricola TaxID=2716264 RepID=A0ABX0JAQ5_9BACL|nr:lactate racemase domain-containing protein [Paenibacillus agricola]NHN33023.1 DUF2088 domain-containing protein [Paenibacillus agricola]